MRPKRARTKKLIVAFHFQFANQAAWKCDDCRKSGLEKKRRCGWRAGVAEEEVSAVWARRGVVATECPASYVSAESLAWIEEYVAWKLLGGGDLRSLPARTVEAFCLLENERVKEAGHDR